MRVRKKGRMREKKQKDRLIERKTEREEEVQPKEMKCLQGVSMKAINRK